MLRSRWAVLALAGCAVFSSGCLSGTSSEGGGLFGGRFRPASWTRHADCDCCESYSGSSVAEGEGPMLAPQGEMAMPPAAVGAPVAPPPRIVPIPQANPVPYSPTNLKRRSSM